MIAINAGAENLPVLSSCLVKELFGRQTLPLPSLLIPVSSVALSDMWETDSGQFMLVSVSVSVSASLFLSVVIIELIKRQ